MDIKDVASRVDSRLKRSLMRKIPIFILSFGMVTAAFSQPVDNSSIDHEDDWETESLQSPAPQQLLQTIIAEESWFPAPILFRQKNLPPKILTTRKKHLLVVPKSNATSS